MTHDKNTFILSVADIGVGLPPGFDLNTVKSLGLVLVRMSYNGRCFFEENIRCTS